MLTRLRSWFRGRAAAFRAEDLAFPRPAEHLFRTIDTLGASPVPTDGLVELDGNIVVTHDTEAEMEAWSEAFGAVTIERKV